MIVQTDWLAQHCHDPDLVIIDTRPKMSYDQDHIRDSCHVSVDQIIQMDQYGSHLVCDAGAAKNVFGGAGIDDTKTVLVCGEYMDPSVFRVAWTLLYFGHKKTLILGSDLSCAQDVVEFSRTSSVCAPAEFVPKIDHSMRIKSDDLSDFLKQYTILDARSIQEFMGGHIPSAVLVPFTDGAGSDGEHLKTDDTLESMFLQKGISKDDDIVCYCMHGHRASSLFFQLRQAGYTSVKLYDGSFVQWHGKNLPLE